MVESDITDLEYLKEVFGPLKVATTVLCDEKVPTISIMAAFITQLNAHFGVKEGDRSLIKDVKTVMFNDFETRYQNEEIQ